MSSNHKAFNIRTISQKDNQLLSHVGLTFLVVFVYAKTRKDQNELNLLKKYKTFNDREKKLLYRFGNPVKTIKNILKYAITYTNAQRLKNAIKKDLDTIHHLAELALNGFSSINQLM